jgi:hypothetical protein
MGISRKFHSKAEMTEIIEASYPCNPSKYILSFFEVGFYYIAQAGPKLMFLLPQSLKC